MPRQPERHARKVSFPADLSTTPDSFPFLGGWTWPLLATSLLAFACQGIVTGSVGEANEMGGEAGGTGGVDNASSGGGGGAAAGGETVRPTGGAGGTTNVGAGGRGGMPPLGGMAGVAGSAGAAPLAGGAGAAPPPAGSVQMFVAVGRGGRRIMSCDRGRTWIANQMVAPESQDGEHETFTPKGLAYGNGTFIFLSGWGTDSTTWASSNGLTWSEKKHDTGFGGIGFDKGAFVAVGGNYVSQSTDKGATWTQSAVQEAPYNRENAAFDGIWAAGSDGNVATRRAGSNSWEPLSGCSGSRHGGIGTDGGYASGLGFMVSVGDNGDTCGINIATGAALNPGKIPAVIRGKPAFVKDAIWVASGDEVHTTTDGVNWSSRALPSDVRFDLVARSASGTYVGADSSGDSFYFSDDGQRWTKAKAPSGNGLTFLLAGAGSPSSQCPLP